jgi:hypothetical protein
MYYTIDLEIVSKPVFSTPVDVLPGSSNQAQKIPARKRPVFKNWAWYAAAALIILVVSLLGYFYSMRTTERKILTGSAESVQSKDYQTSPTPLNIDTRLKTMPAADKISLNFIENQLLLLHKKGIENFTLYQSTFPSAAFAAETFAPLYNKSVPVDNCLEKVQSIKKYKSYLTISELVSFLSILEKQGV